MELNQDITQYWHAKDASSALRRSEIQKQLKSSTYKKIKLPKTQKNAFPELRKLGLKLPSLNIDFTKKGINQCEYIHTKQHVAFQDAMNSRKQRKLQKDLETTFANIESWKLQARSLYEMNQLIKTAQLQEKIQTVDIEIKSAQNSRDF